MSRPRVVIVGGGFGGMSAAKALTSAPVDIVIVDRANHHLFQPLLYQVATGILADGEIAPSLRGIFREDSNAQVRLAEVTGVDLDERLVAATAPDGDRLTLPYDFLIVAAGATHNYFGHDEWAAFAPGLKSLSDANSLRGRILGAFEMAADASDPRERQEWLTFVTVGAGPTGVELTAQIAELSRRLLRREFTAIDTAKAEILLLDAGPGALRQFPARLQAVAERDLRGMGVEIRSSTKVTGIDARGVEVEDEHANRTLIAARTVIWAAGVQASPLARILGEASGAQVDRAGRVAVNPDCTLPGHPEVFAIGDMVSLERLPGVAQPAIQEARYAARVIRARLEKRRPPRFHYIDKGSMATIGRGKAVANAFGLKLGGFPAAVLWALVHLMYLVGWGNRVATVARWVWALAARDRRGLCVADVQALAPIAPPTTKEALGDESPTGASGPSAAIAVHNRLDKVVLSVPRTAGAPIALSPDDARGISRALEQAATTAERTPAT